MLEFTSPSHFENVADMSEQDKDNYIDNYFRNNYAALYSDPNFFIWEDSVDLDEDKIYREFESNHQYVSMRAIYASLLKSWEQSADFDTTNHPFLLYPYSTADMTLYNEYGQVKVGNTVLWLGKVNTLHLKIVIPLC